MKSNKHQNIMRVCLLLSCATITFANNFDNCVDSCNGDYAVWTGIGANQIAGGHYIPVNITVKIKKEMSESNTDSYQGIYLRSGMNFEYQALAVSGNTDEGNVNELHVTVYGQNNEKDKHKFLVDEYGSLIVQTDSSDKTSFHLVGCAKS